MYYKFLNSYHVDRVMVDGTMVVSSLGYFRGLEARAGDIADPLEGATELTVRDAIVATEGSVELAMLNGANIGLGLFKQFAKIEGGGKIEIGPNSRFLHLSPDLYIYSLSEGDLGVLTEAMCVSAPSPYDACLSIKNPIELVRACLDQGTIKNLGGRRVCEVFEKAAMGSVEYVPRTIDMTEGKAMEPDPFKKGQRFSSQSEARFVFVPRNGQEIVEQRLVFVIPDPARHFSRLRKFR